MTVRYEISIVSGAGARTDASDRARTIRIDPGSTREIELFLARLPDGTTGSVSRPVVAWRGATRSIIQLHISRAASGEWQLELGEERPDVVSPEISELIDPRLEDLTTMVWVTDSDRLARWFNSAWIAFVGADLASELGWGWMRHMHPDDLLALLETYDAAMEHGHGFEHVSRVADRDGSYWWFRTRAAPRLVDGVFNGFVGMCEVVERAGEGDAPVASGLVGLLPPPDLAAESPAGVVERLARLEATLEVTRPADTLEAAFIRRLASRWITQHDALRERHDDIVLSVSEAAANGMLHAYRGRPGRVRLTCEMHESHAEFRVRDWGEWRTPPPDHDGRGVALMDALADEMRIEHLTDGTDVVLRYTV